MRLPDFCIIGAQKAGTSTLHSCLCSHDDVHCAISPTTGEYKKEVHFFSNRWENGVDWYRAHFVAQTGMHLDATPNYLCDPNAHERMSDVIPNAKLVPSTILRVASLQENLKPL